MQGFESEPMHAFPLRPMQAFRRKPTSGFHRSLETARGEDLHEEKEPSLRDLSERVSKGGFPYPCFAPRAGLLALFGGG